MYELDCISSFVLLDIVSVSDSSMFAWTQADCFSFDISKLIGLSGCMQ